MDIKPIRTNINYRAALTEIESLMNAAPRTPRADRLDALVTLRTRELPDESAECHRADTVVPSESRNRVREQTCRP